MKATSSCSVNISLQNIDLNNNNNWNIKKYWTIQPFRVPTLTQSQTRVTDPHWHWPQSTTHRQQWQCECDSLALPLAVQWHSLTTAYAIWYDTVSVTVSHWSVDCECDSVSHSVTQSQPEPRLSQSVAGQTIFLSFPWQKYNHIITSFRFYTIIQQKMEAFDEINDVPSQIIYIAK